MSDIQKKPRFPGSTESLLCEIKKPEDNQSERTVGSTNNDANFEEILKSVGEFGRYQQLVVFGILLPAIFAYSFAHGFWLFVIATPDKFWCRPDPLNLTYQPNATSTTDQQCYEEPFWNHTSTIVNNNNTPTQCQHGWDFDQSVHTSTIVSEWYLVCASDFLPTLVYILTTLVGTLGAPIGGYFSDHYGRKKTYFACLLLEVLAGVALAMAPSYTWFVLLSSIHSISNYPTYQTIYTLGMEILSPAHRTNFSVLVGVFYALGTVASCGVAYMVRDWRLLVLACTIPLVGMIGLYPVMPESPRFNLTRKRFRKVEHFFRRAAKWNGVNFDVHCKDKLEQLLETTSSIDLSKQNEPKTYSFRDIFQHPILRRRICVLMTLSAVVAVWYGGLGYYAPKLGTNPHLNIFLTNLVDLPASLLTQLVADRLGRRLTLAMNFILGGMFCLASLLIPTTDDASDYYYPVLVLFLFARMFAVSSYTVEELVSCEVFPTVVRGEGISLTNGVSGVVSNLGPLIVYLCIGTRGISPMAWFGGIAIAGSVLVLWLPETVDQPLPETLEDVDDFTMLRSISQLFAPVSRPRTTEIKHNFQLATKE